MRSSMELIEYVPGVLYLLSSHAPPPDDTVHEPHAASPLRMAYIHVEKEFPYQNFYLDFGPLHLAHVAAFARTLDKKLRASISSNDHDVHSDDNQQDIDTAASSAPTRICVYTSMVPQHRANAACLLGCWAILVKKWAADRAFAPFQQLHLPAFHDASPNADCFGLGVLHVLRGFERAVHSGLFPAELDSFDDTAFLEDMDPDRHDLTWITPRIAAFAGPQSQQNWFGRTKPHEYVEYFRSRGVSMIVRLNKPKYDKHIFSRVGIDVVDLYFPDGTCPPECVVAQFLALCTASSNAKIAVHCRAGLGRTGTLIACHLMQAFQFSAEEAIGWLRLCRPGSVIGTQQHFLRELQPRLSKIALMMNAKCSSSRDTSPEDLNLTIDEDQQEQQQHAKPRTKGIATRRKESSGFVLNAPTPPSVLPPRTAAMLLPPRVPGHRVAVASTSHATQGDLLLLRKHAQHMPLPLGASLWPQAPSVGGD